jgi:hypothetical protein
MILISHRGNTDRINRDLENTKDYIDQAIDKGFEVEIDIWLIDNQLFLGHDKPERKVEFEWLQDRSEKLWIHTKNSDALEFFISHCEYNFKFFWHTVEPFIITSNGKIWAHEYANVKDPSTCIIPPLSLEQIENTENRNWYAVCTDFPEVYKKRLI